MITESDYKRVSELIDRLSAGQPLTLALSDVFGLQMLILAVKEGTQDLIDDQPDMSAHPEQRGLLENLISILRDIVGAADVLEALRQRADDATMEVFDAISGN